MLYPEDRVNKTFKQLFIRTAYFYNGLLVCAYLCSYLRHSLCFRGEYWIFFGDDCVTPADTLFATAFALFISTVLERNTNLVTSGVSIVTCILAGCFIPIAANNPVFSWICKAIPQTEYMNLVHGIEFGGRLHQYTGAIIYILLWTALLLLGGTLTAKNKIEKGIC